uniref:Protein EARLY HEADING DATE 2 n=1 Tax=Triticum aestivum TaxID=4565 RepID=A0A3B6MY25_WHEAT
MAAASSAPFFGLSDAQMQPLMAAQQPPAPAAAAPAPKKKRNQPGNPNPDAEVIALSPRSLMATNRFVCEVCGKGFQREQNLQLHRRGHNLPWKLKQKNPKETRRRVYLCPEPTCVHHDPARALGDLTGIKKHYCRKHGEKKWKCDKCAKRYAVQSDWKAHSKTCGTREYRCDCGTLFSRRDSFITHRAFCDALAQESARLPPIGAGMYGGPGNMALGNLSGMTPQMAGGFPDQSGHHSSASAIDVLNLGGGGGNAGNGNGSGQDSRLVFQNQYNGSAGIGNNSNGNGENGGIVGSSSVLGGGGGGFPSLYSSSETGGGLPQMSATALLQKAAQMGATTSSHNAGAGGAGLLRGPGMRGGSGEGGSSAAAAAASERQSFHDLIMNSLGSGSGASATTGGRAGAFGSGGGFPVDDGKLSTRDFLGVGPGGVVQAGMGPPRRHSGGAGLHMGSLDPAELK